MCGDPGLSCQHRCWRTYSAVTPAIPLSASLVKWMKGTIFLRDFLTFVFVYSVELIVLWAGQAWPICFLSFMSLSWCMLTSFSVIMQQAVTDSSLLHLCCLYSFKSMPLEMFPLLISSSLKMEPFFTEKQFHLNSLSIVPIHRFTFHHPPFYLDAV